MEKLTAVIGIITALCFYPFELIEAAACCQLSSSAQESLGGVSAPAAGQFTLHSQYSFTKMDRYKEGRVTRSLDDATRYVKADGSTYTSLPLSMEMAKYTLTVGYGFSSKLKALISLPFVRNTMVMSSSNGAMLGWSDMNMPAVSGSGDATAMGLYRLFANSHINPTEIVTLGFGLKAPTGSFTEKQANGKLVHAHMQPGTGSWDPLLSLIYAKTHGSFFLQTDASFQYAGRNNQGYAFGNSAALSVTEKYTLVKNVNIGASLTYLHVGRASDKNNSYHDPVTNSSLIDDPANTGENSIWFSPNVQFSPVSSLVLEAKVQWPIREEVNGIQLVSRYGMLFGMSYVF